MMSRGSVSLVVALAWALLGVGLSSSPAAAQEACDPATFDNSCSGETLTFCNNQTLQVESEACSTLVGVEATCGSFDCVGPGCTGLQETCLGVRDGACAGAGGIYADNPDAVGGLLCSGSDVCAVTVEGNQLSETCRPNPGVSECGVGDVSFCEDNIAVVCFGGEDFAISTPATWDCGAEGSVCELDGNLAFCAPDCGAGGYGRCDGNTAISCFDGQSERETCGAGEVCVDDGGSVRCLDEQCGSGRGRCQGAVAVTCDGGNVVEEVDCLTTGQTCDQANPDQAPSCIVFDPACGPIGQGVCLNAAQAVICDGGQVISETDCRTLDRVCDELPAGGVGCVERPAPDPDDEDEDEDEDDEDEDEEPAPSGFACGQGGGAWVLPASLLALRRRRR